MTSAQTTRVTVVMPLRNFHPGYLQHALQSVSRQTSESWSLLVVLDVPLDTELRQLLDSALGDDRASAIPSEGRGFLAALNTGLRRAPADFISILFADDVLTPTATDVFTSYIERFPDVDFFHAGRAVIDEQDRVVSSVRQPPSSFTLEAFAAGSPIKHPFCCRRELALAVGGMDESLDPVGADDWDFPWSMAEAGARFMAIPECLYLLRDHRDSFRLTTHIPRTVHVRNHRRIMRKHGVGRWRTERWVATAKRGYLRQCLYRSSLDRWLKERLGHDARRGWREPQA